jgi:hypothetical protein
MSQIPTQNETGFIGPRYKRVINLVSPTVLLKRVNSLLFFSKWFLNLIIYFFKQQNLKKNIPTMPPIYESLSEESCITLDSNQSIHDCDSNCSCTSFITSTFLNDQYPRQKNLGFPPSKKSFFRLSSESTFSNLQSTRFLTNR